jgi:hypothetical protein
MSNSTESVREKFLEQERQKYEDVKGYLEANGQASARTRYLIVVLIVASVLTAVGVLNSLQESWMSRRIGLLRSSDSPYLVKYIGQYPSRTDYDKRWQEAYVRDLGTYDSYQQSIPQAAGSACKPCPTRPGQNWFTTQPNPEWYFQRANEEYERDKGLYERRYLAFLSGASTALVDNRFFVRVPFLGMTFDVNDLGMLSGVGLVSILLLLWFSSGTELENLRSSFTETQKLKCLAEFYRLAAMRQVLTIPPLPGRQIRWFEVWLAKPVYFLAPGVYLWLLIQDLNTNWIGKQLDTIRMRVLIGSELFFLIAIVALAIQSFLRSRQVDSTWTHWWFRYIAEQFERTAAGEWLRLAWEAFEQRQITPRDLVGILPQVSGFSGFGDIYSVDEPGNTHTYKSKDAVQLVLNLRANSAILETTRPAAS